MPLVVSQIVNSDNFDERAYLRSNPDVAKAVRDGAFTSGRHHFNEFGYKESRRMRVAHAVEERRKSKMTRLSRYMRSDLAYTRASSKLNYLSDELRALSGIVETDHVSANAYDSNAMRLVEKYSDGLVLDCGAGMRDTYFDNVVNFEIVDYDTTDVLGVGEELPFVDGTFDAVISIAVLEHVKDPFRCAREIIRVLKPGGELYCAVPFLQPLHGYPHHYYNMSHQGLRSLFDHSLEVTGQDVLGSTGPIWSLSWFLRRWAAQLPEASKQAFLKKTVSDLLQAPTAYLEEPWVQQLPKEAQFELASATVLFASKPRSTNQ